MHILCEKRLFGSLDEGIGEVVQIGGSSGIGIILYYLFDFT